MEEVATAAPRQRKPKRKHAAAFESKLELERLNSLLWNPSLPQRDHDDDYGGNDPFAMLTNGSSELEGGFLSLEEIDEADYGLVIPKAGKNEERKKNKKKKSERDANVKEEEKEEEEEDGGGGDDEVEAKKKMKKKKDKKKKKKKKKTKEECEGEKEE